MKKIYLFEDFDKGAVAYLNLEDIPREGEQIHIQKMNGFVRYKVDCVQHVTSVSDFKLVEVRLLVTCIQKYGV